MYSMLVITLRSEGLVIILFSLKKGKKCQLMTDDPRTLLYILLRVYYAKIKEG